MPCRARGMTRLSPEEAKIICMDKAERSQHHRFAAHPSESCRALTWIKPLPSYGAVRDTYIHGVPRLTDTELGTIRLTGFRPSSRPLAGRVPACHYS
jgi:hypothetical protein